MNATTTATVGPALDGPASGFSALRRAPAGDRPLAAVVGANDGIVSTASLVVGVAAAQAGHTEGGDGEVAVQLTAKDALAAHGRDELGLTDGLGARPVQAALSSAATFAVGAAVPLAALALVPMSLAVPVVALTSLASLAGLGATSARLGGASAARATARVTFWGALAMGITAGIGALVGAVVQPGGPAGLDPGGSAQPPPAGRGGASSPAPRRPSRSRFCDARGPAPHAPAEQTP